MTRPDLRASAPRPVSQRPRQVAEEELTLVYDVDGMFTGAGCTCPKLSIRQVIGRADANAPKR